MQTLRRNWHSKLLIGFSLVAMMLVTMTTSPAAAHAQSQPTKSGRVSDGLAQGAQSQSGTTYKRSQPLHQAINPPHAVTSMSNAIVRGKVSATTLAPATCATTSLNLRVLVIEADGS